MAWHRNLRQASGRRPGQPPRCLLPGPRHALQRHSGGAPGVAGAGRTALVAGALDAADWRRRALGETAALRTRHALPERFWLSVTSPNANKGWPDLVHGLAIARASGLKIPMVIAGYWMADQRRDLTTLARTLGVADLVHFMGYVEDDVLPALYAQALGFIFASRREGFGLP